MAPPRQILDSAYMRRLLIRFNAKVNKDGPVPSYAPHLGTCSLWMASKSKGGYGAIGVSPVRKGPITAHRVALMLALFEQTGEIMELPLGHSLTVDHLCRTPACVRVSHLEWVTHQVNIQRKPFIVAGLCKRGHRLEGSNVSVRKNGKRRCRKCVADFTRAYYHAHGRLDRLAKRATL